MSNDVRLNVYIGYDRREYEFWDICKRSILQHCNHNINIVKLDRDKLSYEHYWRQDTDGATAFSHCRFLVPFLSGFTSTPTVFMDCDMILTGDICKVLDHFDPSKACSVVKHPQYETNAAIKMDSQKNNNYPRKNWSSFVLWNPAHESNAVLTPSLVNTSSGSYLHRFTWLKDEEIGELPPTWNYLVGESLYPEFSMSNLPMNAHFTLGSPLLGDEDHNTKGEFIPLFNRYR